MKSRAYFMIIWFLLGSSSSASPASTVSIRQAGDASFALEGHAMESVAAMELVISYDRLSLANPRMSPGPMIAGAVTAINPNQPGIVRIAIIRTNAIHGAGRIANIVFDRFPNTNGGISGLKVKIANINGNPLPVHALCQCE